MGLFDKIKDVVKDVAPVVLPFAINAIAPGLGTIASGALGAGIGTLIQGGDIEDALKAGAMGGATGALYKGIGSMAGGGKFMEGISSDLGQTKTFLSDPLSPANYGQMVGGSYDATPATSRLDIEGQPDYMDKVMEEKILPSVEGDTVKQVQDLTQLTEPTYTGGPFQAAPGVEDIVGSQQYANRVAALQTAGVPNPQKTALDQITKEFTPSFAQKFGLPAAAGIGALALMGDEDEPEEEEFETGADLFEADPSKYMVNIGTGRIPTMQDVVVPYARYMETGGVASVPDKFKGFSKLPEGIQQKMDPELAKKYEDGGDVEYFPRRNGGIGPGEGSGTKDDVPAMLMDGEFVMTRNAVKAAGGGNMKKGINNMYGLMRNLEARA
jgi:hypothetical protein